MPNRKSEKKSLLQNEKHRVRNHAVKSRLRTLTTKVKQAIDSNEKEQAEVLLKSAYSLYDKAAKKHHGEFAVLNFPELPQRKRQSQ